jgi:hypothetical protein
MHYGATKLKVTKRDTYVELGAGRESKSCQRRVTQAVCLVFEMNSSVAFVAIALTGHLPQRL